MASRLPLVSVGRVHCLRLIVTVTHLRYVSSVISGSFLDALFVARAELCNATSRALRAETPLSVLLPYQQVAESAVCMKCLHERNANANALHKQVVRID